MLKDQTAGFARFKTYSENVPLISTYACQFGPAAMLIRKTHEVVRFIPPMCQSKLSLIVKKIETNRNESGILLKVVAISAAYPDRPSL